MILSLRANAKLYLNGAVLTVDRKVNLELLNDATFLLEAHVIRPESATTPLRQLYLALQIALIDPAGDAPARAAASAMVPKLLAAFDNPQVRAGLSDVAPMIARGRLFDAMKALRGLFPTEDAIMGVAPASTAA